MKELKAQFEVERQKKEELEKEMQGVKDELENIENRFPQEMTELKDQIEYAKQQTQEYERKTISLQKELEAIKNTKK